MIVKTSFPKLFNAGAITIAPFIFVLPEQADDQTLIAHEKLHLKEQLNWLILPWWVMYLLSKKFRLNAEIRAYKLQISMGGCTVEQAAHWLATNYMLGITHKEAIQFLK